MHNIIIQNQFYYNQQKNLKEPQLDPQLNVQPKWRSWIWLLLVDLIQYTEKFISLSSRKPKIALYFCQSSKLNPRYLP